LLIAKTMERAAASRRDGEIVGFEPVAKHVTAELSYVVEVERWHKQVRRRSSTLSFLIAVRF